MKKRSQIYDTYWYFAAERQNIFFKRLLGASFPYTDDPIFREYKFCNAYRALDRVSQFLIRSVMYDKPHGDKDTLFRIFMFRLLNRIETWRGLETYLGEISLESFSPDRYAEVLDSLKHEGPIYGNAFILCANKAFGFDQKHRNHLALLEHVFRRSEVGDKLLASKSLRELFLVLRDLPLIGDFMAYQLAIDFNYSVVFDFSENEFTVAGPGAKRGIAKCFEETGGVDPADVIQYMVENQDREFKRLGLEFKRIGSRPLQAIDCQNIFCETDKYCRAAYPELASNRVRIKTRFSPQAERIQYVFPPKWGVELNML